MKKKTPLQFRPAETPKDWGNGLAAFRERHKLTWRDLESVCERKISRRSLHRLCKGDAEPRFVHSLRPLIIESLRRYLQSKKVAPNQVELELRTIFCKEEIQSVLTQRTVLNKAAQNFFGLRFDPFSSDPRSRAEVFTTPTLDRMAHQLEDAINYQQFVAVIGEIGAGKSLLKRRIVDSCLTSKGKMQIYWPEFMNMDKVHSGSIASFLLRRFGQTSPRDLVLRADRLKIQLAALAEDNVRVALGFDECHRLDPRLLTALKNFWELGSGGYDRYLGLILFGQPRFEMMLRNPEFREISERCDIIRLPNLGRHAWDYVAHRVRIAGGNAEKLFERATIERLAEIGPTPLAIGNLANAAILKAHSVNEKKVTRTLVTHLFGDDKGEPKVRSIGGARS